MWESRSLPGFFLQARRFTSTGFFFAFVHLCSAPTRSAGRFYRRFADEAKITSALRHPHIIQVTDFDQADETPFIAMEYLDGVTLNTRVRYHGPLSLTESVEFLRQVGSSLQAAHDAGVVHRDIKPQNILLCRYQLAGKEAQRDTTAEKAPPIPAASTGPPANTSDRKIAEGEKKPPIGSPPIAPSSLTPPGAAPSGPAPPQPDPKVALATPPPSPSPPAPVSPPPSPEDVKAACDQGATQKARNLYWRLEPRQRDFVQFYCGRLDIDVTSRAPAPAPVAAAPRPPARSQPTPQELAQLIQQARDVLEADPKQASKLLGPAIESGSGAAWLLYGMAACKQHSKSESFASYKQLDVSKRQELIEYCAAARFPLR